MLDNRGSADSHVTRYRPDIDGLRAVAVLSVIAYHLSDRFLRGGFLGVDIFFVISGYLITGIVWREALEGRFSIRRFYERRIRRIMPALLAMLAVVSALSAKLLLSVDLIGYAKSVFATLTFVANVYFWQDTANYFGRIAEEKPLLHMWSLGIEEQFYIFFPLILVACFKWRRQLVFPLLLVLVLVSLVADIVAIRIGGGAPAFYLLPTRAWELGLGALLALTPWRPTPARVWRELLACVAGWLLYEGLRYGVVLYYGCIPASLLVTVGSMLVILLGTSGGSWLNGILSLRPIVWIGLISYSLYLWHWPLLVFSRYYLVRELRPLEMAATVAIMFVLAYGSWRFVERPFRDRRMAIRSVLRWAGGGCVAAVLFAAAALHDQGWPGRMNAEAARINAVVGRNYRCPVEKYIPFDGSRGCLMNMTGFDPSEATVALVGNSHAQMFAPLVTKILAQYGKQGVMVPANLCLPTTEINLSTECMATARTNLEAVEKLPNIKVVILAMTWKGPFVTAAGPVPRERQNALLIEGVDQLIARFEAHGQRVVLVGPIAIPGWDVASIVGRQLAFGYPVTEPLFVPQAKFSRMYGEILAHYAARKDVTFLRLDDVQCVAGRCDFIRDGQSLFADDNHVAAAALPMFRGVFEDGLGKVLAVE